MEYDCQIVLANKIQAGFNKVVTPLCTHCKNRGCSNPIEEKKISIFGRTMTSRMFVTGSGVFMVVACEGYQAPQAEDEDDEI